MQIQTIHWDAVPACAVELPSAVKVHAVWPSPVDADACFAEAGFTEFADSDAAWDSHWREVVLSAIDFLKRFGEPRIRRPIVPVRVNSLWQRVVKRRPKQSDVALSLVDQMILSTEDARFPPAVVDFGEEPSVTLAAGDGHPMLWFFSGPNAGFSVRDLLSQLRPQRPHSQRRLDWSVLRPPTFRAE